MLVSWDMYSDEGDALVEQKVSELEAQIKAEAFMRSELLDRYEALLMAIAKAGHDEVYDTEPRGAIIDAIGKACDAVGWVRPLSF